VVEPKRWWVLGSPLEEQQELNKADIDAAIQPFRILQHSGRNIAHDVADMITMQASNLDLADPYCELRLLVHSTSAPLDFFARSLAAALFRDERAFLTIDCSTPENSADRLFGYPPGYRGCLQGGIITNHLKMRPASVTILTNFEYADDRTLYRVDKCQREGYFSHTVARGAVVEPMLEVFGSLIVLATTRSASLALPSSPEDTLRNNLFESLHKGRTDFDWDHYSSLRDAPLWSWNG
jgi:hypothetical protein